MAINSSSSAPRRGELWVSNADNMAATIVLGPRWPNRSGVMTWDVLITRSDGVVCRTVVCGIENNKRDGVEGLGYFWARQLVAEGCDG